MSPRTRSIRESIRRISDWEDSQTYGGHRDWSYLNDPEALYERRGALRITAVA